MSDDRRAIAKSALARGHTISAAAALAGISRETLRLWMNEEDADFGTLRQARDLGMGKLEEVVLKDCLKNGELALKVLGVRRPRAWGRKDSSRVDARIASQSAEEPESDEEKLAWAKAYVATLEARVGKGEASE